MATVTRLSVRDHTPGSADGGGAPCNPFVTRRHTGGRRPDRRAPVAQSAEAGDLKSPTVRVRVPPGVLHRRRHLSAAGHGSVTLVSTDAVPRGAEGRCPPTLVEPGPGDGPPCPCATLAPCHGGAAYRHRRTSAGSARRRLAGPALARPADGRCPGRRRPARGDPAA